MLQVDESKLNRIDRLGLAYCRLNDYQWDDLIGPKPEGFDDLPRSVKRRWPWQKKKPCKSDYIRPAIEGIESIIGEANISRCWWLFVLGKTEEEWFRWYVSERFKVFPGSIR